MTSKEKAKELAGEEFVIGFTNDEELTPIDIVAEITGLTIEEIRSCSETVILEIF